MATSYKTQDAYLAAVSESLDGTKIDNQLKQALVQGVRQGTAALETWEEQENPGLELRLGRWFIRSEDLPFFQLLGAVATLVVGLATTGGVAAPALVGPITSFSAACWQVRRKGANLTPEQVTVFGVLSTHHGLRIEDVVAKLVAMKRDMSADEVRGTLTALTRLELHDGSEVPIVRCDGDEQWRALPV